MITKPDFWMYEIIHTALIEELRKSLKGRHEKYMEIFGDNKFSGPGAINLTIKRIEEMKTEHDSAIKAALEAPKFITKEITLEEDTWEHIRKCADSQKTSIDTVIELGAYAMGT